MKLRDKNNLQICDDNHLPIAIVTNVVEERNAKNKMRATSDMIAKALIATLGPYGSSTIIQDQQRHHFATKDGYDLMNRIEFDDAVARTILDLFRTTASSQVFTVGDGSTSAIVVANALFQALTDETQLEHFKKIAPKDITDILNDLTTLVESELIKMSREVSEDMHELDDIAAIADNNDKDVGKMIADIYRKIGKYGFITMDTLEKYEQDTYEIKSGVEWSRGYIDPIFGNFFDDEKVIYDQNPRVILSSSALTYDDIQIILIPLIKHALNQENAELLIVANDFSEDVVTFLKNNRTKHMKIGSKSPEMQFTAVDIDQVTKESRNKLDDLALLCGCTVYDKNITSQADVIAHPEKYVGYASKVVVTPKSTQVIVPEIITDEYKKKIKQRIHDFNEELIKLSDIEVPTREEDHKIYELRQRLSRLTGSTAVLHVGGRTLAERTTRQRLLEDAVFAGKSALTHGYIPGGNLCIPKILNEKKIAFASILGSKYNYLPIPNTRNFFVYFIDVVKNAFLESYRAVLNNSYMDEETVERTIETCLNDNKFYNLKLHSFEDWDKTAVINSTDTDIQILKSCVSIIGILALSNQLITLNMDTGSYIKKE